MTATAVRHMLPKFHFIVSALISTVLAFLTGFSNPISFPFLFSVVLGVWFGVLVDADHVWMSLLWKREEALPLLIALDFSGWMNLFRRNRLNPSRREMFYHDFFHGIWVLIVGVIGGWYFSEFKIVVWGNLVVHYICDVIDSILQLNLIKVN